MDYEINWTRARLTDPATSHAAAATVPEFDATHFAVIVLMLKRHGPMCVSQIARCTGLAEQQINKRLPEIRDKMQAVRVVQDGTGDLLRRGKSGRWQRVWEAHGD